MKKLFTVMFLVFIYTHSFALNILQTSVVEVDDSPPSPSQSSVGITPYSLEEGEADETPINSIIPILLITASALVVYMVRKNKEKTI